MREAVLITAALGLLAVLQPKNLATIAKLATGDWSEPIELGIALLGGVTYIVLQYRRRR